MYQPVGITGRGTKEELQAPLVQEILINLIQFLIDLQSDRCDAG